MAAPPNSVKMQEFATCLTVGLSLPVGEVRLSKATLALPRLLRGFCVVVFPKFREQTAATSFEDQGLDACLVGRRPKFGQGLPSPRLSAAVQITQHDNEYTVHNGSLVTKHLVAQTRLAKFFEI